MLNLPDPHDLPNIFLIGMPGAGKSTVGRALARKMDRLFIDTDEEIVKRNGVTIATIFEIEGEAGFRHRELGIIKELTQLRGIVMATGGGAILQADNRQALHANGCVVYLAASIEVLVERTSRDVGKYTGKHMNKNKGNHKTRPLLIGENIYQRLSELLAIRSPLYAETAHITVEANHTNCAEFIDKLAIKIAKHVLPTGSP
jgi:shikimate kinase